MNEKPDKKSGKLKFEFNMKPGELLRLNTLVGVLKSLLKILNIEEKSLTHKRAQTKWQITNMGKNGDIYFVEIGPPKPAGGEEEG
jgi:hypothetical protein